MSAAQAAGMSIQLQTMANVPPNATLQCVVGVWKEADEDDMDTSQ